MAAPVFLGPASINILPRPFGRLVRPVVGYLACFDRFVLIALFSVRVLWLRGTGTIEASRICPPRAMYP
jgi:hypothetical protein